MAADPTHTAARPWDGNCGGDPRQLLLEAEHLEARATEMWLESERHSKAAKAAIASANQMELAANDYRRWAAEQMQASVDKPS